MLELPPEEPLAPELPERLLPVPPAPEGEVELPLEPLEPGLVVLPLPDGLVLEPLLAPPLLPLAPLDEPADPLRWLPELL